MRVLALHMLRACGVLDWQRFRRRHQLVILTVHGVMAPHAGQAWQPFRRSLAPEALARYLLALRRAYTFVPLSDAVEMIAGQRPLVPKCLALTFDDGYRNNLTHAWPILRRYGVPATFFVCTGFVEHPRPFWFDRLDFAVQHLPSEVTEFDVSSVGARRSFDVGDRLSRRNAIFALIEWCKTLDGGDAEWVVQSIERRATRSLADLGNSDDWTALLNVEDVCRLAREGATLGSHTVDHSILSRRPDDEVHRQLADSKRALERWLGRPCPYLCYPSGQASAATRAIARRLGFLAAVTTREGTNPVGTDLFQLHRYSVGTAVASVELLAQVSGLSQALRRLGHKTSTQVPRYPRQPAAPEVTSGTPTGIP